MENSSSQADHSRPLSYADLRRFFGLVVAMLLAASLIHAIAPILLLFATVFLLAMVLNPLVTWLEGRGLSRSVAVVCVIVSLLAVLTLVMWLIVPLMWEQITQLIQRVPVYEGRIRAQLERFNRKYPDISLPRVEDVAQAIQDQAIPSLTGLLRPALRVVTALFTGIIALLLLAFTLSHPRPLVAGLLVIVPDRHREATRRSLVRMMQQMQSWIKATLINGAITGISTGLLLHFIGVQPALVFGTLAFFGEFVPNIGPVVTSLPALFVALGIGPEKAGLTLLAIVFVQQVESNILVPFIMGKQMKLHPVGIIFFALVMGSLFGIVGAVLAVPTAAATKILVDEFYLRPRRLAIAAIEAEAETVVEGPLPPPVVDAPEGDGESNATAAEETAA
jgi:predicted PurR-regulated permease PerM